MAETKSKTPVKKAAPKKSGPEEKSRANLHKIPFKDLEVEPEFNKRLNYGDIEDFAHDIQQHGIITPLRVQLIPKSKNKYYVREGHRRHRALEYLTKKGIEVGKIPCLITNDTREVSYFKMASSNSGLPFSLLERGLIYEELIKLGFDAKEIQERYDVKNIGRVYDALKLAQSPKKLHIKMAEGIISQTAVLQTLRECDDNWDEAAKRLDGAIIVATKQAKKEGKDSKKVTAQHIKGLVAKTPIKKMEEVLSRINKAPDKYVKTRVEFLEQVIDILSKKGTIEDLLELLKK